jgi:uncharacterized RDD family membrane protein YckC
MAGPGHRPIESAVFRHGPARGLRYAGFWIRMLALLLDLGAVVAVAALAHVPGVTASCGTGSALCDYPTHALGGAVVAGALGAYRVLGWSVAGASIGQALLGLRVVRALDGRRVSVGRGLLRYGAFLVAAAPLAAGLAWVAVDAQKQGWHDKLAGTFVVRGARGRLTGRRAV